MKPLVFASVVAAFFTVLCACTPRSDVGKRVVVKVNNHQLTGQQFAEKLAHRLKDRVALSVKDPISLSRTKQEIVSQFILESLLKDSAQESSIQVTDDMIKKELDQMRSGFPDDLSFRKSLAEENLSLSSLKDQISQSLLTRLYFGKLNEGTKTPTAAEIKTYYEANKSKFIKKDRIYLRQIVVDDLVKAEEIKKSLPQKDFGSLASKFSISPEAKSGGVIGWVEKDSLDTFEKAFALPVGAVSPPLESPYGVHLFKVEKKKPAGAASLDEVQLQIQKELEIQREQAAFLAWLDKSLRKSTVLKNTEYIEKILVETRSTL